MSFTRMSRRPRPSAMRLDQRPHLIGVGVVGAYRDACPAGFVDEASRLLDCLAPRHGGAFNGVVRPVTYTVAPAAPSSTAMPRPAAGAAGDDGAAAEVLLGVGHAGNLLSSHS